MKKDLCFPLPRYSGKLSEMKVNFLSLPSGAAKIWILLFFLFTFFFPRHSPAISPAVLLEDGQNVYPLCSRLDVLEDKTGRLAIGDITSGKFEARFVPNEKDSLNIGFTGSDYWIRFRLKNTDHENCRWLIEIADPLVDRFEIYFLADNGKSEMRKGGDFEPFRSRDLEHRHFVYYFSLCAGQEMTAFIHFRRGYVNAPLNIWTPMAFTEKLNTENYIFGLYYGFILSMIIYNLFIFFSMRDISYLYYVLFIFSQGVLAQMALQGLAFEYFWPDAPVWNNQSVPFSVSCVTLWASQFTRSFLDTRDNVPRLDRVLSLIMGLSVLVMLLAITVDINISAPVAVILTMITIFVIALTAVVCLTGRKNRHLAFYYLTAWGIFLFGGFLISLDKLGLISSNPVSEHAQQIGSAAEGLILSFALGHRIRLLRKDKEHAQAKALEQFRRAEKLKDEFLAKTEKKVEERTRQLNETLTEVEDANRRTAESIRYATMIQRSLLSGKDVVRKHLPHSFTIWKPRDIVGGDILFSDFSETGMIGALADCTGHGIPGAFMTMIASSGLRRIIKDEGCHNPAEILKKLNFFVKTTLHQDTEYALSDDGLDAVVCFISYEPFTLTFAGAKRPLICIDRGELRTIRGDRKSIGYKKSDLNFNFTNHSIPIREDMSFYMFSDGITDQLGGDRDRRFGIRRLTHLLMENSEKPFDEQRKILLRAFEEYRGDNDVMDDVTVVGFSFEKPFTG